MPQDAEVILSIPLSVNEIGDRVIWARNKNGRFSVKSAYRLAQEDQRECKLVECSNPTTQKQTWRRLWQMNVLNKVKHFAWKACRNILATKETYGGEISQRIAAVMHVEGTWNLHATCFGSVATQRMFGLLASSSFLLKFNPRGTS